MLFPFCGDGLGEGVHELVAVDGGKLGVVGLELQSLPQGVVLVEVLLQEFVEVFQELLGGTLLRSSPFVMV